MARGLLDALEVARHSEDDIALVDDVLKPSVIAKSPLIAYRLASDFQTSWKVEVSRWLLFARRSGFLPALTERIQRRVGKMRLEPTLGDGRPDPNEGVHRVLRMELAPAMLAYYLSHSGWEFVAWETAKQEG